MNPEPADINQLIGDVADFLPASAGKNRSIFSFTATRSYPLYPWTEKRCGKSSSMSL